MKTKYVIAGLTLLAALLGVVDGRCSDSDLKRKIDSLFVIASSGELRYQKLTEPAMDSIAALGTEAVPILIDKFTTKSARERWTIIWTLKRIGARAVPLLIDALRRTDGLVVERVCYSLGDIGDSGAVTALIGVMEHSRWQVRDEAATALGKIGDPRGREIVAQALSDSIGLVRKSAVVATGKLRMQAAASELVHAMGDEFYGARLAAVDALMQLDTLEVVKAVRDSIMSANDFVGDLGCMLLGRLGTEEAVELLLTQIKSPDADRRAHAALALIKADPEDHCGYRRKLIEGEIDRFNRLKMQSALQSLTDARK
ncbi:MAG TPA: HEAT repeat domain-containing protein [Candidatus Deferrimicrobium sp.]|nr:HEAT repeat domain-containing protein [Candidatus Deferrimicrobium sp.]